MYIVGTILHVHTLRLRKKDEVNSILLATHFGIVKKVWVHNFHLYHYLIEGRIHVRIAQYHWGAVRSILSYVSERLWGEGSSPLKITLDDFIHPAVAAWRDEKPYAQIVCDLPESVARTITTSIPIPFRHPSLSCFSRGYTFDSNREVDIQNDDYDKKEDYEILLFLGYPSVPYVQP